MSVLHRKHRAHVWVLTGLFLLAATQFANAQSPVPTSPATAQSPVPTSPATAQSPVPTSPTTAQSPVPTSPIPSPAPPAAGVTESLPRYIFAIVHDANAGPRAHEFEQLLLTQIEPFRSLGNQVEFKYIASDQATMQCQGGHGGVARVVTCDDAAIATLGAAQGAHMTLAFTSEGNGGSGGTIPVASTSYPLNTLAHEMLHTFGLGDEYAYLGPAEIQGFCQGTGLPLRYPNVVAFQPAKNPFASDDEAKSTHASDLPWSGSIAAATLVTTGNALGATGLPPGCIGRPSVYAAGYCSAVVPSWKPYCETTIMESLDTNEVPLIHQQAILARMSAEVGHPITRVNATSAAGPSEEATQRTSPRPNEGSESSPSTSAAPAGTGAR